MEARTQAKAVLRYARISPRKVNIVNDLIRNKNVSVNLFKDSHKYL